MGRRVYGAVNVSTPQKDEIVDVSEEQSLSEINDSLDEIEDMIENFDESQSDDVCDTSKPKKGHKKVIIFVSVLLLVTVLSFIGAYVYVQYFPTRHETTYDTSSSVAKAFVESLNDGDITSLQKFVPDSLQAAAFSDNKSVTDLLTLIKDNNIQIKDVSVIQTSSQSSMIGIIQGDISKKYNENLSIDKVDTVKIRAVAHVNQQTSQINTSVVCFQIRGYWYVYDGMTETTSETIDIPETENATTTVAIDDTIEKDVANYNLNFKKSAVNDLSKGLVTIDDVTYTMPVKVADFKNLLIISDDLIKQEDRLIPTNQILKSLPFKFVKDKYSSSYASLDVGNPTKKDIDIADGIISTFMIHNVSVTSTPNVLLPGNVTFGTTKKNVKKMYGKPDKKSTQKDDSEFYVYRLNNKYNNLTITFTDGVVSEIKWYYYDLSSFK